MLKHIVEGHLIAITETHYITENALGRSSWNKNYYRLSQESEPKVEISINRAKQAENLPLRRARKHKRLALKINLPGLK